MTPIAIAPGAPTGRSGRIATLGMGYVARALEACQNTDEERVYFKGILAKHRAAASRRARRAQEVSRTRAAWQADFRRQRSRVASLAEPKGHMAELADGWMPDWVKVPT